MKKMRVGSRESTLAVAQAELVLSAIRRYDPSIQLELVTMKTTGDRYLNTPLQQMGGKSVFIKELEQALLDGLVDICVHSLKDMAVDIDPRLPICAVGEREDPRDVLLLPDGMDDIPADRPIGSCSRRRTLQLKEIYPGYEMEPVRGNILTRMEKLAQGQYGALVLAAAGLKRLGLQGRISRYFTTEQIIPACGQGIIAVQARKGEQIEYLKGFHSDRSWDMALAERAFVGVLDGGCSSPATAYARIEGDELMLTGYAVDRDGQMVPGSIRGPRNRAEQLGAELGATLKREAGKQ